MPMPISKVQDSEKKVEAQFDPAELMSLIPLIQLNPVFMTQDIGYNKQEKDAIKQVWLNSSDIDGDKIEVTTAAPLSSLAMLKSKGYLEGNGKSDIYEITAKGKRLLKDAILDEEESSFCKTASKQMMSKNSYDFDEEVLIRVNHPEEFGAKYISLPKASIRNNKIVPRKVDEYKIATKKENGESKSIKEYKDEELIAVLHLAKKIIRNASSISEKFGKPVPVNRIKAFSEMIMSELNSEER